ncbi:dihydrodipicolinate synthase [Streptomyces avermitilis]|uniref:Dihydrodipicolinate synthase n=2 Tax=Streptomyces avermitilis TaxID=33903 RepID=Q82MC9_STRAW|nr:MULTISPECIES: dihydrodipicolinate synthase family protein [Streptomyces]KUN55499.1 dihydrodipicolinate synthase [Streptomyces avermitilis]MYS97356.1 dihydrodipicolinate synthase family protein [Streptomyces sp. SID5469]OOV25264.1 dihydrodipicolinate synthase family protein [Streptomyces avermitilis]BAC69442.1 putative dihydrodipicolinate synthase [Streptomyces avermitilis MA-4680 = NBRC 14893]GDY61461.1 dihydrodipicolinate synthase family protein [Streptomyces avermitilis]
MTVHRPWRGVLVATALPLTADLAVDHDKFAEHCAWLVEQGCDGVVPNGSLGEYQVLTPEERARVVETAVSAVGGARVMPGVAAYGSAEARRWAEQARDAGCRAVMLLPPNAYRADERSVRAHYAEVAKAGVPVVAYNNPIDTKVDLVPELLAALHGEGYIHAVKEFSGDVRRAYRLAELAPELDLLIGADDVLLELAVAGAKGWVAGYPNALPAASVELYHAAVDGDLATATQLYRQLHPLLRWDSRVEFVQAIKMSMDVVGRYGGPVRPPRVPLLPEQETAVRAATEKAVAAGLA